MTKPLTIYNYTTSSQNGNTPPVVKQLNKIFKTIPDDELLTALKAYYAGRNGYTHKVLWRTYVAMSVLNLPSFAALIRTLENNPFIALACGITGPEGIPSKYAYSRFIKKLQARHTLKLVKDIMRELTRKCYETFPDFGKSVAIDSTDLKAWSNGGKEQKTDPDAGWVIKAGTERLRKFVFGYKLHLMVDTEYEIPIAAITNRGNMADIHQAKPLLRQGRFTYSRFRPDYVICDAGYSSRALRKVIWKQWRAVPIVKSKKSEKRTIGDETHEWQLIYNRRTSVERCFSRLKGHRRLNKITVRNRRKVTVHNVIPVIVMQAMALAFTETPRMCT
ncbi:transposase [Chloroflexota bacterium]